MNSRTNLALVAVALFAVALVAAVMPSTHTITGRPIETCAPRVPCVTQDVTLSCGTVLAPLTPNANHGVPAGCAQARSGKQTTAIAACLAALVVGAVAAGRREP